LGPFPDKRVGREAGVNQMRFVGGLMPTVGKTTEGGGVGQREKWFRAVKVSPQILREKKNQFKHVRGKKRG